MALKFLFTLSIMLIFISAMEDPPHQRLIKLHPNEPAKWMSTAELEQVLHYRNSGYQDLTRKGADISVAKGRTTAPVYTYPSLPTQQKVLLQLFPQIQTERMALVIQKLSSYPSRHALNNTEVEDWLNQEISSILAAYKGGASSLRHVAFIPDPKAPWIISYNQKNIILKLDGQDEELKDELIILGSHYDSINRKDKSGEKGIRAPGADDNASGCAVLLEVLRLIVNSEIKLKHGLELHWYGGEEQGLLGSQDVVSEYKDKVKVRGMLNVDCVGYQNPKFGKTMAWFKEATNEQLTEFVKMLVGEYTEYELRQGGCTWGCISDHQSWTDEGFPAAVVAEAEYTPHIHTVQDTPETINIEQVKEFAKVALAFVVELSETETSASPRLGAGWITGWIGFLVCIWKI